MGLISGSAVVDLNNTSGPGLSKPTDGSHIYLPQYGWGKITAKIFKLKD
jgi:hypothetical protein